MFEILKILCDVMEFGALAECPDPDCRGKVKFDANIGYMCTGVLTWADCSFSTKAPERREFSIPEDVRTNISEL